MTENRIRKLCLSFPGATEEILWGGVLVFKVAGKMFLCMATDPPHNYSFKCPENAFLELTELPGIKPAPYLARAHWIQIDPTECILAAKQLEKLIRQSYDLVVAKLPGKTQKMLMER